MVVGDGLAHICNNRGDVARSVYIRSIQCNDNNQWCLRLFHVPASVTSSAVLCMRKGTWAVKRTTCVHPSGDPDITQSLRHVGRLLIQGNNEEMHRLVSPNVFRPKYLLLNVTFTLGYIWKYRTCAERNTTLWYTCMLLHKAHKNKVIQGDISWEVISYLKSNITTLCVTTRLQLYLGTVQQYWYSLQYDTEIPSPALHVLL